MRISDSSVSLYGSSKSIEKYTKEESLKMWVGNSRPNFEGEKLSDIADSLVNSQSGDAVLLSSEGREALEKHATAAVLSCGRCEDDEEILEISEEDKQKIYLLQRMIEFLTGKRFRFKLPRKIKADFSRINRNKASGSDKADQASGSGNPETVQSGQRQGWGLEYDLHETHYEKQTMSFSAEGMVKTADGREIKFDLDLNLSREFASRLDISIRAGDAVRVDPLVINFDSASATLTSEKYSFDIDADGTEDQISFATGGSGFLAFDINNDGIINNGLELFGPRSGNGFSDLAVYDEDGNGWIDENDDIYDKLRIWTKDEHGNDRLFALGQKGIGAICLGSTSTAFDLKTSDNRSLGHIAQSGIFLKENGLAGTIQHVDLVI